MDIIKFNKNRTNYIIMIEFAIEKVGETKYRVIGRETYLFGLFVLPWRFNYYDYEESLDDSGFRYNWRMGVTGSLFSIEERAIAFYNKAVRRYGGRRQKNQLPKEISGNIYNPYDRKEKEKIKDYSYLLEGVTDINEKEVLTSVIARLETQK